MRAEDFKFGIEIETHVPRDVSVGDRHRGLSVHWLPPGWNTQYDGSIRAPGGRKRCEWVSGRLQGADGVGQIGAAARLIRARGAKVNSSCGVHITVGFDQDSRAVARLVTLVAGHEDGFYAITGAPSRRVCGYCKSIKAYGHVAGVTRGTPTQDRRHLLNVAPLSRRAGNRAVEFRVFSGSLNATKLMSWAIICLNVAAIAVSPAARDMPSFDPPDAEPVAATQRLLRRIEAARLRFGLGVLPEATIRRAMLKMARRYAAKLAGGTPE